MSLTVGTRMLRQDDGMLGIVELMDGVPRIVYVDRGERFVAGKAQKWEPAVPPRQPLRREEMERVAMAADRELKALELHEPLRYWEAPGTELHDRVLFKLIVDHLGSRK